MEKNKRSGLPTDVAMKHDTHYVELMESRTMGPRIRMILIGKIDPNPQQARTEMGDLDDLMSSIKEKGVLEPIIVRPHAGRYEIIAGERRYVASKNIDLQEIPCIIMDVEDNEAMELSLIENLQRKNLDVFEEADGLNALIGIYGYTHDKIANKIGKARSTITESIQLSRIPKNVRHICKENGITSRSTIIEIAKQKNEKYMLELLRNIVERNMKREDTRDLSKELKGRDKKDKKTIKKYVYNYIPLEGPKRYKLRIEFNKPNVDRFEIIDILEEIIKKLKYRK
ncbi:MAG: ParB/RepB/Spo0J family partition protein [Candidatus Aminicenantes bacterium]|nr:ParB/RepB/Spo0J family partition protein [Candidatus Aminicenantes bacterium]